MPIIEAALKDLGGSVRAVSPVSPVQGAGAADSRPESGGNASADGGGGSHHDQAASAADYARANAQIASIYANFSAVKDMPASLETAYDQLVGLMPAPTVVIPMPPASVDMVEQAVALAKDMAERAALARAAHANVNLGTVDQILTSTH